MNDDISNESSTPNPVTKKSIAEAYDMLIDHEHRVFVSVSLSQTEKDMLVQLSAMHEMSMNAFIRSLIRDKTIEFIFELAQENE